MTDKELMNEADMLEDNVNRMMVTDDKDELINIYIFALKRLEKIYRERFYVLCEIEMESDIPKYQNWVTEESKERKGIERTCRVEYHNVDGRIEEIPVCCSTCEHYVYFSGYEVLCRKYKGNQRFGYSVTGDAYQKCLYKDWTWKGH